MQLVGAENTIPYLSTKTTVRHAFSSITYIYKTRFLLKHFVSHVLVYRYIIMNRLHQTIRFWFTLINEWRSQLKIHSSNYVEQPGVSPRSFDWGATDSTEGTDSGESKPPTPKFRFLLGFRTLYLGNVENLKILASIQKFSLKYCDFWGFVSQNFEPGGRVPPSPPVAKLMRVTHP